MYSSSSGSHIYTSRRRSTSTGRSSRETIVAHCRDHWLPLLLPLPSQVKEQSLRQFLVDQSTADPMCMLSLMRFAAERFDVSAEHLFDFLECADDASISLLYRLAREGSSSTKFSNATPIQGRRVQQAALATGAARALTEHVQVEPNKAFLLAMLPQLGHLLFSWNYPHLYVSSVARARRMKTSLDEALQNTLKLSPSELTSRVVRSWRISTSIQDLARAGVSDEATEGMRLIHKAARLTAANVDPSQRIESRAEFETLCNALQSQYGFDIERATLERCHLALEQIKQVQPKLVQSSGEAVVETDIDPRFPASMHSIVLAARSAPPELALAELIPEMFDAIGCVCTSLYRYDAKYGESLTPVLTFGTNKPQSVSVISPLGFHPFADSFYSQATRIYSQGALHTKDGYWLTTPLTIQDKLCLLYSELPADTNAARVSEAGRLHPLITDVLKQICEKLALATMSTEPK